MNYTPTIGIEMHCEMKSISKVFSGAANTYSKHPNSHVSAIDLGLPGILPVLNKECIRKSILMASILHCEIPDELYFDRKNYYYPDLPKGYQITQSHAPIGTNGWIEIPYEETTLNVKIHDIHLEEDTAKMEHLMDETLLNYNRAGVPLLELVTEPVFHDKKEVIAFIEYIRKIYQYTDISDADVKKGQIRCDVNISINNDDGSLGTRVEIKNVNSLANIEKAIDAELKRQIHFIELGEKEKIEQETRRFDETKNETVRMRSKVDAIDYKYFVEPNIPKIKLSKDFIAEIEANIIELPLSRMLRYKKLGLPNEDIILLTKDVETSNYFDKCLQYNHDAKLVSNFLNGSIAAYLNKEGISFKDLSLPVETLHELLLKVENQSISLKQAKEILEKVLTENKDIKEFLKETSQISDDSYLEELIKRILDNNKAQVEAYHNGRTNLFNYFVGEVMKETKGKANPVLTKQILNKYLQ